MRLARPKLTWLIGNETQRSLIDLMGHRDERPNHRGTFGIGSSPMSAMISRSGLREVARPREASSCRSGPGAQAWRLGTSWRSHGLPSGSVKCAMWQTPESIVSSTHVTPRPSSSALEAATPAVKEVTARTQRRQAPLPYTTSTLQQDASTRLRYSPKKTMSLAQELYEGIDLGERGTQGLITYMRTDSTRVSEDAVKEVREYIASQFGPQYLPASSNIYKSKKDAQDAHEAIRPTSAMRSPDEANSRRPGYYRLCSPG